MFKHFKSSFQQIHFRSQLFCRQWIHICVCFILDFVGGRGPLATCLLQNARTNGAHYDLWLHILEHIFQPNSLACGFQSNLNSIEIYSYRDLFLKRQTETIATPKNIRPLCISIRTVQGIDQVRPLTNWNHIHTPKKKRTESICKKTKFVYIMASSVISMERYKYSHWTCSTFALVDFIWFSCLSYFITFVVFHITSEFIQCGYIFANASGSIDLWTKIENNGNANTSHFTSISKGIN